MNKFEEYESFVKDKERLTLEELFTELTSKVRAKGHYWKIQYSEIENLYYGYILDYGKYMKEAKKIGLLKDCIIHLLHHY